VQREKVGGLLAINPDRCANSVSVQLPGLHQLVDQFGAHFEKIGEGLYSPRTALAANLFNDCSPVGTVAQSQISNLVI